jgi:hypothetical protein
VRADGRHITKVVKAGEDPVLKFHSEIKFQYMNQVPQPRDVTFILWNSRNLRGDEELGRCVVDIMDLFGSFLAQTSGKGQERKKMLGPIWKNFYTAGGDGESNEAPRFVGKCSY